MQAPDALLKKLSDALASATGKPESYVMTLLDSGVPMTFAGSEAPCAYVEIKSIGALTPPTMSDQFCELIKSSLGIPKDRIYIGFDDVVLLTGGGMGVLLADLFIREVAAD